MQEVIDSKYDKLELNVDSEKKHCLIICVIDNSLIQATFWKWLDWKKNQLLEQQSAEQLLVYIIILLD